MSSVNQLIVDRNDRQVHKDVFLRRKRIETAEPVRVDGKYFARGRHRLRVCGLTYGPFPLNDDGDFLRNPVQVADDFAQMAGLGVTSIRTYHLPPDWLFELAEENALAVFVDIPWRKHLCFLDSEVAQREARSIVRDAVVGARRHPSRLAYSIGNEIPPSIVRWHGRRSIERFLAELTDVARQADSDALVTYANFPPTEYLELPFLDFATFNVYLHDPLAFRKYLIRLQNHLGDKPLVLGELGMDTIRHGELAQAQFLDSHLKQATLAGLAGAFVFSWTDDWFTGGHQIDNWAFGVTDAQRNPKAACSALRDVFQSTSYEYLSSTPRVSIVVCTYNGGSTLQQCLRSLETLEYPNYEVIVVDDGSTDNTATILEDFDHLRIIRQTNLGLSEARNVGLRAATGDIVAYTDSDCFADPQWLTLLVHQLQETGAAGVGGPNLTPEDGRLACCVSASPGQPTHVLESDQIAEHIPGCNMAFRREALLAVNGFDPMYRKAGDDVDLCWRLQQAGHWITFAPGAFVWHHRRQTPAAYLRQQAGYGEAEALLRFKHPDKFNGRGDGKWRGVMYGASLPGLRLGGPIIYRGTFGTGLFQTLYQPGPAHWAMLPSTLEWHLGVLAVGLIGIIWPWVFMIAGLMWATSLAVAGIQAAQSRLPSPHDGFGSRLVVACLCYLQPLIRAGKRYRTRCSGHPARRKGQLLNAESSSLPLSGRRTVNYWCETEHDRIDLLQFAAAELVEKHWGVTFDSGWACWDMQVHGHPWTFIEARTVEEEHGGGKRLIRVGLRVQVADAYIAMLTGLTLAACGVFASAPIVAGLVGLTAITSGVLLWRNGCFIAGGVERVFDGAASKYQMVKCATHQGGNYA